MKLSALILVKNEEDMIENCLSQLKFADEIVLLDQNSTDKTVKLAQKYTTSIYSTTNEYFDNNRELLAKIAKGKWLLYIDADERISSTAISQIKSIINDKNPQFSAYYFPRKNFILSKWVKHGGWWPDYSPRLFLKSNLSGWVGKVHESPIVKGKVDYLKTPITHLSGRNIEQMFNKTIKWAKVEADLNLSINHPHVSILSIAKAMIKEFIKIYLIRSGFLDGTIGLIEAIYQALHQAIVLTYLWEMQNKPGQSNK